MPPPRKNYTQIPLLAFSDWASVGAVTQALTDLEVSGNFRQVSLLKEAMGRDDRISGVFETRLEALNGLPLEFEPSDDSAKAQKVADECKLVWDKMLPEAAMNELRDWGLWVQLGVGEMLWDDVGADMWIPAMRPWNPQYVFWRWDTWKYYLSTASDGIVELNPGVAGDRKWITFSPAGGERGWMRGFVRSLAIPWLIRQFTYRDWARYSEVHGQPIRGGVVPQGGSEPHKERFMNELAALGSESVIRLEQGGSEHESFDLKLIEAVGNTWEGFEKLLQMVNTAIAVRLLGQNLTTEGGSGGTAGSRALGDTHEKVKADIIRSDASKLSRCLREQMLEPWALFNFGDATLAPKPKWKVDDPGEATQNATTYGLLGAGIAALQAVGINVDTDAVATEYAIPTKAGKAPRPQSVTTQPNTAAKGQQPNAKGGGKALQSSKRAHVKPHIEAQLFNDELTDEAVEAAKAAIRPDLAKVLACIAQATDYPSLRAALKKAFAGMTGAELSRVTRKALVLAELNGAHSVLEETA